MTPSKDVIVHQRHHALRKLFVDNADAQRVSRAIEEAVGEYRVAAVLKARSALNDMEACGSSHHWARELSKLGHEVKLIAPDYVKPYVKRGKSDAADAEAICEAVTRPTMRFEVC